MNTIDAIAMINKELLLRNMKSGKFFMFGEYSLEVCDFLWKRFQNFCPVEYDYLHYAVKTF